MKIQCPHCDQPTELTFEVNWKDFACPYCNYLFKKDEAGSPKQVKLLPQLRTALSLQIGHQGVLEGTLWEVGGICIKIPVSESYGWTEYTLYSAKGMVVFLSEYNGHWILAKEITGEPFDIAGEHERTHKGNFCPIFHDTKFRTEYAAGLFDHPVPEKGAAKDFLNFPDALLLEKSDDEQETYAFEARHVAQQELTEGFPTIELPEQVGQGMLQPFPVQTEPFFTILASVGGLILLIQLLLFGFFPSYKVLSEQLILTDSVSNQVHISPSFASTGLRAPLEIQLSAPVNNSWAAVDFCLINEETKEERYGTVEVAYYYGSDGGESWTEGSTHPSIKICGVPPGTYHFLMQVSKEPNTPGVNALQYKVIARSTMSFNLLFAWGLLAAAAIIIFLWKSHFERMRWMNSDFPPEEGEE